MSQYDLVVIGSGPGGYVAAIKAGQAGKKVAIVEKKHLGGICLNWGCIPTKALLKSAEVFQSMQHASDYGLSIKGASFNYSDIIKRSRKIADINSKGVQFLMKKNKIEVIMAEASIIAAGMIKLKKADGSKIEIQADKTIIATGASARETSTYPIDGKNFITYHKALELQDQSKKMLVIGSGAIGSEFSYYFNSLGTEVHLVEMAPNLIPNEDEESSKTLQTSFENQGIKCYPGAKVETKLIKDREVKVAITDNKIKTHHLMVDRVLVAIGMVPNTQGLGLEGAGIQLDEKGFIKVNSYMQTSVAGVYAIGDVTGKQMLAHKASVEGEVAVSHMLGHQTHGMNYDQIPGCTYCIPQIASIGITEKKAKKLGKKIKIGRFPFQASGKARAIGNTEGFVKLIFGAEYGELLGAHIVGQDATEILAELGLAMKLEATYEEIMETIHAHPTLSEAIMEAAMDSQGMAIHI